MFADLISNVVFCFALIFILPWILFNCFIFVLILLFLPSPETETNHRQAESDTNVSSESD